MGSLPGGWGAGLRAEAEVAAVFVAGLALSRGLGRRWHPTQIATMAMIGLLFEIFTAHAWRYHGIVLLLPLPGGLRVSAGFPFAWSGVMMAATDLAEAACRRLGVVRRLPRYGWLMAGWFVAGNASEITFYNLGLFEYVRDDATWYNFVLGQAPHLPPWAILLGYPVFFPPISLFFEWMERGLAGGVHWSRP